MTKNITALTNQEIDGFNSEYFAAQMNESIRVLALYRKSTIRNS